MVGEASKEWIMVAVVEDMECTKSIQLLEQPGLSMDLELCVAKLEAETGGVATGGTFSSMRKVVNW